MPGTNPPPAISTLRQSYGWTTPDAEGSDAGGSAAGLVALDTSTTPSAATAAVVNARSRLMACAPLRRGWGEAVGEREPPPPGLYADSGSAPRTAGLDRNEGNRSSARGRA